ncbi:MAG: hypothetical protein JXM79_14105 [Sedimentisphaerales bacterium]|nr:hypothetical protein [Sedimentisphaerales bacterium]
MRLRIVRSDAVRRFALMPLPAATGASTASEHTTNEGGRLIPIVVIGMGMAVSMRNIKVASF